MENDPATIRQEIEATRERMADTAEAIAYKADVPSRVKENLADRVDAVKGVVSDAAATVSATLTGVAHTTKSSASDLKDNVSGIVENAKPQIADATDAATNTLSDLTQSAKSAIAGVSQNAKQRLSDTGAAASNLKDNVSDIVEHAKPQIADATDAATNTLSGLTQSAKSALAGAGQNAKQRLSDTTAAATDLVARTRDNVPSSDTVGTYAGNARDFVAQNPLGLALGSLAAGFLVGLALPISDIERDNVGPIGDRVAEQAKATATDLAAQGKAAVVSAVTEALKPSPTTPPAT